MPKAPPEHVLPLRLARAGERLEGVVPLDRMTRLATLLHESTGEARFVLRFGYDGEGQARVLGRIDARPVMLCQRCLEPMQVEVACDVSLALLAEGADTSTLDPGYDPLVVGQSPLALADLVEDEIILALPNFARHPQGVCRMPAGADAEDDTGGDAPRRENPFAVLKSLNTRKRS